MRVGMSAKSFVGNLDQRRNVLRIPRYPAANGKDTGARRSRHLLNGSAESSSGQTMSGGRPSSFRL
jgi:hypothetical protein